MPTRERPADRGARSTRQHLQLVGTELREARLAAGLSQGLVARQLGLSHSVISRLERAAAPQVSIQRLDAVAAVLGLRLSLRFYPAGRPVRDAAQLALLERLRRRLGPGLRWRTEVVIPLPGDLRAWDATIDGRGWTVYVDAETVVRDVQALQRRTALKARDSGADRVLLLIAATRSNRAVLAALSTPLLADPLPARAILAALEAGRDPGGSGEVLL